MNLEKDPADGKTILDGYIKLMETVGEGAFCKVKRVIAEVEDYPEEEGKEGKLVH